MVKQTTADVIIRGKDQSKKAVASAKMGVGGLTKIVKSYFAEIMIGVMAMRKLFNIMKELTTAYGVQELAVIEMNNALQNTGIYTPQLSKELQILASELQKVTRHGDEVTIAAVSMLQSIGKLDEEMLKRAIPAVQDLADAMFKGDMRTAANMFAKVVGSSTNALTRYGIEIDMTGTKTEKFEELMRAINDQFGGRARETADSYTGSIKQLGNKYGDLKESMGELIATGGPLEGFIDLANWAIEIVQNWTDALLTNRRAIESWKETIDAMNREQLEEQIALLDKQIQAYADEMVELDKVEKGLFGLNKEYREAQKRLAELDPLWQEAVNKQKDLLDALKDVDKQKKDKTIPIMEEVVVSYNDEITMSTRLIVQLQNLQILRAEQYRAYEDEIHIVGKVVEANDTMYGTQVDIEEQLLNNTEALEDYYTAMQRVNAEADLWMEKEKAVSETLKATQEAEKEAEKMSGGWARTWEMMGDTSMTAAEKIKEAMKMIFADLLRMIGKELLIQAFKLMIPFLPTFNPAAATLAMIGSAMAYTGAGFIESLAQGGQFTTSGTQLIQVGDNPSGRERVTVEPLNGTGGTKPTIIVNVYGSIKTETDITEAIFKKGREQGFWR